MVDAVANVHLESLRDLLVEEVKFLSGVSDEVTKVEADLRTIHGLLMEADSNGGRTHSPALKNCIDELKELAFKAENVLETYAFEVESKKEGKSLKKKLQRFMGILCECYSVHQIGDEIDDIRSRLADLTGRLGSVVGEAGSSNLAHQEQRRLLRLRNLEKLPDGLRFISTLESVECYLMSEELKDRMRRDGGTDYANFSHIPSLVVW